MTLKAVIPPTPIEELLTIMARLRHPIKGSPWEREQTSLSIAPNMLEEAYEAVDAITHGDVNELRGELGDVLLQVVFHAQIAREQGHFGFNEVVETINNKIKSRLPAFFSGQDVDVTTQLDKWEEIKREERAAKGYTSIFDGIAPNLPALVRANKLQSRASQMGFAWNSMDDVYAKIEEETQEVREAEQSGNRTHLEEEIGDLLNIVARLANMLNIDAEQALRHSNIKFEKRLRHVEQRMKDGSHPHKETPLETLMEFWREAKAKEKASK